MELAGVILIEPCCGGSHTKELEGDTLTEPGESQTNDTLDWFSGLFET